MKHEFVVNIRRKYKINQDEALRGEILNIISHNSNRGRYSIEAMKNLLNDLEKIKYEEFEDYHLKYLDDEYIITTNCLTHLLASDNGHIATLEELKWFEENYPDSNFKSIEEHDNFMFMP